MNSSDTSARIAAALLLGLAISACGRPEDPVKNQADVAETIEEGQKKVDDAAAEAVQDHLDRRVDAEGRPLGASAMKQDADSLYRVDRELAEANYKVAQEKCQAVAGAERDSCLKLAKADFEVAMAAAKARQAGTKAEIERAQVPPAAPTTP